MTPTKQKRDHRRLWGGICCALLLSLLLSSAMIPTQAQETQQDQGDKPPPPTVNAEQFVVLSDFNQILYGKNAHVRRAPASLTKMMTAIVAVRYADLDKTVTVVEEDLPGEASMGLWVGEVISISDLLWGLLLPSGNDAAMAIAHGVGQQMGGETQPECIKKFVQKMNEVARQFGLQDTHFMNPHGLDQQGHYSSPYDLAIILRAALNHPEIRTRMQTLARNVAGEHDLYNGNDLLVERNDMVGGKTGLTDNCGYCLAGAARQNDRMVIAVVMGDDWSWFWDVSVLLDYGFQLINYYGLPEWASPSLVGTQLKQEPPTQVSDPPPIAATR